MASVTSAVSKKKEFFLKIEGKKKLLTSLQGGIARWYNCGIISN